MHSRRLPIILCLLLVATACLISLAGTSQSQAGTAPNSWLDKSIESTKRGDLSAEQFQDRNTNLDRCKDMSVREWDYPWYYTPAPILIDKTVCGTSSGTGYFGQDNTSYFVLPYGGGNIQRLKRDTGGQYGSPILARELHSVSGTNRLVVVDRTLGLYDQSKHRLGVINDWNSTFQPRQVPTKNVERLWGGEYDYMLGGDETPLEGINTNGMVFSANGEWLHVKLSQRSYVLLNLDTREIIPYAPEDNALYSIRADVSNDGRFVARTHDLYSLKIYDTTRCQASQSNVVSRDCESKELLEGETSVLRTLFPGKEITIGRVKFIGSGAALDVDLRIGSHPNAEHVTYRLKPSGSEPVKYLAMGDSFSSGEGAYDYIEATDIFVSTEEYNVCHLSRKSYPYLLQDNLQADWFHSVACSGADSKDVIYAGTDMQYLESDDSDAKVITPISGDIITGFKNSMRPGYTPQYKFVAAHKPSTASISMGGNDVGFANIISSCVFNTANTLNQSCFYDREERESKANEIDKKISEWSKNFVDIKNSLGGSDPKLYVIGYPQILNTDDNALCGYNVPFLETETKYAEKLTNYLNTAIKVAADAAGVRYVDVSDAFMRNGDSRLCGNGPYAVNGLNASRLLNLCNGASKPEWSPSCSESFHPNQRGHKLMSETVLVRTTNLTQLMPQNTNSTADLVRKRIEFVGDADITLQNYRITYWKDIAPALIAKGEKIQINIPKSSTELPAKVGTTASAVAHSTPRNLGQLPISANGTISGELILPGDIETGYHRLIISYTDIADNIVERYTYFYAAQSSSDWDGDGIGNSADPCPSIQQSNVDQDADGVDDACDGEYVKSAQSPTTNGTEGSGSDETTSKSQDKLFTRLSLKTKDANPFENSATIFESFFTKQDASSNSGSVDQLSSRLKAGEAQTSNHVGGSDPYAFDSMLAIFGLLAAIVASAIAWIVIRRNIG